MVINIISIEYLLPLRSCNTMTSSQGSEEEFFNTVILEPHPKLVTGQGKGFHIRCKYLKKEDKKLPTVNMKILRDGIGLSGEHVNIGDPLVLNISILHHAPLGHRLVFLILYVLQLSPLNDRIGESNTNSLRLVPWDRK